ncbi:MAG: DUF1189 domain-containing protein [Clostridia bacterium]|nr:DUF1189 domain-containing protein [Clostridia bacterium]
MYIFKSFIRSLYDFNYYKEFFKRSKWKGFLYLTILSVLLGIIIYLPFGMASRDTYQQIHDIFQKNSPDFEISMNALTVDATTPYVVYDEDNKGMIIVMDDSGTVNEYDYRDYAYLILLMNDRIVVRMDTINSTFSYADILRFMPDGKINKAIALSYFDILKSTSFLLVAFLVLFFAVTIHFGALLIGLFGRFLAIFKKILGMKVMEAYNLACYASTLPLIFASVILFFNINFAFLQLVYILLGILYFWNALAKIFPRQEQKSKEF